MTEVDIKPGTAFLIPSGTSFDPDKKHLFFVCTDIDEKGQVVLASVSSWVNNLCDDTCILDIGCHKFVKRKSYILYRNCKIEHIDTLNAGLQGKVFIQLDDASEDVIKSISAGILKSKHTPWKVKRYFKKLRG